MSTGWTLEPDGHMRWIYDYRHPEYHTPRAVDLRERRAAALRACPGWMLEQAAINDEIRKASTTATDKETP